MALADAVIPTEGPLPEALASVDSVRVCCIWVLAAASRVEVSTWVLVLQAKAVVCWGAIGRPMTVRKSFVDEAAPADMLTHSR